MYIESKSSTLGGESRRIDTQLQQLVSDIRAAVSVSQAKVFSISHARAAVMAVARQYPDFRIWAGDMHGSKTFIVTIWADWVADNDKREHFVKIDLPEGMIVS